VNTGSFGGLPCLSSAAMEGLEEIMVIAR
jgi:hypothetical protein